MKGEVSEVVVRFERSGLKRGRASLGCATRDLLGAVIGDAGFLGGSVSVLFCSEGKIRRLKREFFGLDEVTDVLSFPAEDVPPKPRKGAAPFFGDLALCLPFCARQARERNATLAEETALLLVHGMLHLLGHDHGGRDEKKVMWAEQRRLLKLPSARTLAQLDLKISS